MNLRSTRFSMRVVRAILFSSLALAITWLAPGCGSRGSGTLITTTAPTGTQIRIGDGPVDSIIAFEVTIASPVNLRAASGASVPVAVGTNRLELSHMAGKLEPLAIANVPQGDYIGIDVTIVNSQITFLNSTGTAITLSGPASQTITVLFPHITVGATPAVLNIDVNVANSLLTAVPAGIIGINFTSASFSVSAALIAPVTHQEDDSGEIEGVTGTVTSLTGANFVLIAGQSGTQLTFATDGTTQFTDGVTGLNNLLNQVVKVEGVTRADGTLFAQDVEGLESTTGAEIESLVTLVTGNPATSLNVVAQDGAGSGMDSSKVGAAFTVNVAGLGSSKYVIDNRGMDFSGLTVPGASFPFDATTVKAGQRVEVESATAIPAIGGSITADKVRLEQQSLTGTVSNLTAGALGHFSFDVALPADSYLSVLSGQTSVHVFQQPETDIRFTLSNTNTVRVRGLLFWTGTAFNMVARRITQ